ncbi:glycosyl transferase [Actinorhabdospora filicis]|uniref:Glycosyl transferase n=1 Tax=Actinorhabdospora filicis TaxID=1785913 RepID=A0A9W6SNI4_9ACTN|nr:DUF2064 domain-containing protein [Actinorhabdospora filicis]GLZ77846.1 glycosyl transferase [Actinorhabdospora filicis]
MTAVLVIAKAPVAGRAKTRLHGPYTPAEAAALAEAALADTLATVAALPAARRILVLDGEPGPWLPGGFEVTAQRGGGLDERIAAAFAHCPGPSLLIGMDTPQLAHAHLAGVFAPGAWTRHDAYLGPAADGGFWALALARATPALLLGVPMSTATTGREQRARLLRHGLSVGDLPELRDVDTAADVGPVAALAPGGRFAALARELGERG